VQPMIQKSTARLAKKTLKAMEKDPELRSFMRKIILKMVAESIAAGRVDKKLRKRGFWQTRPK
jgi:hypothetical protein